MATEAADASSSDEASTNPSVSSKTEGQTNGGESTSDSSFSLARAETRLVNRSKILVLIVIAIAAAVVGTTIYILLSQEEQNTFHNQFTNHAQEITELVNYKAQSVFTAIDTLSVMVTSLAIDKNATWPEIVVPHFELRAGEINHLANAEQVTFVPLVRERQLNQWEDFASNNQDWLTESLHWQDLLLADNKTQIYGRARELEAGTPKIPSHLWRFAEGDHGTIVSVSGSNSSIGYYAPVWQQAPAPRSPSIINYDLLSHPVFRRVYIGMRDSKLPVLSETTDLEFLTGGAVQERSSDPTSFLMTPVHPYFSVEAFGRDELTGFFVSVLSWKHYFQHLLADGVRGISVVMHDTCGDSFTYELNGADATFQGKGDLHDPRYSDLAIRATFAPFLKHNFSATANHCEYDVTVYPTTAVEDTYTTNKPALYTSIVVLVFVFTALVFVIYDYMVQRRQDKVMATAKRTNAIVSSLFPSNVRDRIMQDVEDQAEQEIREKKGFGGGLGKNKLKDILEGEEFEAKLKFDSRPIADLYPEVTVMFADIVGFTAWSSVREPTQVFTLLETLFAAFDVIADHRRVFKVETVGDCYVAVCGLPEPRKDHALVMARFARDVLYKMNDLTKTMEVILGPDTGDLSLRVGLHSGQVTAGVLRGDKSRFQLFGDTMNTCSRIESTGERNKIHVSCETAALLAASGKSHWVQERTDIIAAKGKGYLKTFWLNIRSQSAPSTRSGSSGDESEVKDEPNNDSQIVKASKTPTKPALEAEAQALASSRMARLIDWNVDVLTRVLKQIQGRRRSLGTNRKQFDDTKDTFQGSILDEVKEIITLPHFNSNVVDSFDNASIDLEPKVVEQLHAFVSMIASLYRENPFHSFEHASHVTMSVVKLLSRIVAPDDKIEKRNEDDNVASILHDHTYGITSDPLTQFACIFAALIHDVDHQGVPNTQLLKENAAIASVYGGRSIAEQNSVDIAWGLLMDHQFKDLRCAIYGDVTEFQRFRQLLVNAVMATDIMDKDAGVFRKQRWERAFSEKAETSDSDLDAVNRKATIVIEHLIQASDVAHTMQHWHIYSKWNERLFEEMYVAYKEGRAEKNPADSWYDGEIGFFDFYIIPLAKKLKACGVFGVSSDEYLNYAVANRKEWEARGKERVESMVAKFGVASMQDLPDSS